MILNEISWLWYGDSKDNINCQFCNTMMKCWNTTRLPLVYNRTSERQSLQIIVSVTVWRYKAFCLVRLLSITVHILLHFYGSCRLFHFCWDVSDVRSPSNRGNKFVFKYDRWIPNGRVDAWGWRLHNSTHFFFTKKFRLLEEKEIEK